MADQHRYTLFLALIAACLTGRYFNLPLLPDMNFLFGCLFAVVALWLSALRRPRHDSSDETLRAARQTNESLKQEVETQVQRAMQFETDLRIIVNTMPIAFCFLKERVVRFTNPAFGEMFGYDRTSAKGMNVARFYADNELRVYAVCSVSGTTA